MKRLLWLTCAVLVLAGCENGDNTRTDGATAPDVATPIMLALEDSGKTIDLVVGQTVTLTLQGNPTTGYEWSVASFDNAGVMQTLLDGVYTPGAVAEGVVGSGGIYEWSYKALNPGEAHVDLAYARSWEADAPAKTFSMTFTVVD